MRSLTLIVSDLESSWFVLDFAGGIGRRWDVGKRGGQDGEGRAVQEEEVVSRWEEKPGWRRRHGVEIGEGTVDRLHGGTATGARRDSREVVGEESRVRTVHHRRGLRAFEGVGVCVCVCVCGQ